MRHRTLANRKLSGGTVRPSLNGDTRGDQAEQVLTYHRSIECREHRQEGQNDNQLPISKVIADSLGKPGTLKQAAKLLGIPGRSAKTLRSPYSLTH